MTASTIIIALAVVALAVLVWSNWRIARSSKPSDSAQWGTRFDGSSMTDDKRPQETTMTEKNEHRGL